MVYLGSFYQIPYKTLYIITICTGNNKYDYRSSVWSMKTSESILCYSRTRPMHKCSCRYEVWLWQRDDYWYKGNIMLARWSGLGIIPEIQKHSFFLNVIYVWLKEQEYNIICITTKFILSVCYVLLFSVFLAVLIVCFLYQPFYHGVPNLDPIYIVWTSIYIIIYNTFVSAVWRS